MMMATLFGLFLYWLARRWRSIQEEQEGTVQGSVMKWIVFLVFGGYGLVVFGGYALL